MSMDVKANTNTRMIKLLDVFLIYHDRLYTYFSHPYFRHIIICMVCGIGADHLLFLFLFCCFSFWSIDDEAHSWIDSEFFPFFVLVLIMW